MLDFESGDDGMALERLLSVDYSQIGARGRSYIDWVQHGPLLGVAFRW